MATLSLEIAPFFRQDPANPPHKMPPYAGQVLRDASKHPETIRR